MNPITPVNVDQIDASPEVKLLITHLQERIQYLEGFETKSSQLEQQYRTLRQDYLVAQAAADYYKRMHEESLENDDKEFEELYNEEVKKRKKHEDTISRLENTLKCLQLAQATTTHNYETLQASYNYLRQNMDKDKETLLNTIRRLKIQCEDMKQSRHYSTSSSIAIPGRDSECSGNYYSGSSFGMSSGSMGSYYHTRNPPRSSIHIDRRRHTNLQRDDHQILDEWKSVSSSIIDNLSPECVTKAKSYVISEISRLTYICINTDQLSWDEKSTQCYLCHRKFSFFLRKHHCRYCGNLFCQACIPHKVAICNSKECKPLKCCVLCERMIRSVVF